MYVLRNTNISVIFFLMTKYGGILAIIDMVSGKFDVNGPRKKVCLWCILMKL